VLNWQAVPIGQACCSLLKTISNPLQHWREVPVKTSPSLAQVAQSAWQFVAVSPLVGSHDLSPQIAIESQKYPMIGEMGQGAIDVQGGLS